MTDLYISEGDILITSPFGMDAQLIPLVVSSCNGQTMTCDDRDYWLNSWRVVDARPGVMWPTMGPKRKGVT